MRGPIKIETSKPALQRNTRKRPTGSPKNYLSWVLFLKSPVLITNRTLEFFKYCVEHNLPICEFDLGYLDNDPNETLKALFQREPIYYHLLEFDNDHAPLCTLFNRLYRSSHTSYGRYDATSPSLLLLGNIG